ncbi:FAD-dependent monooxygenase [Amycolatopsis sp. NPDC059021]|uniref:FAD-dependent monooxygenase n=1 Tax=Amycolatopsis sp. NPDC059021 TaxID=3346704 RepID=UPI00366E8C1C
MTTKTVLVSGAGVAGITLAYWLGRYGFDVTVVERAGALRRGGQAIDIRGAALDVAERMGVLDDARAAATDITDMSYVDASGKRIAWMDGAFGAFDPLDVEILRGDLLALLCERAGAHAEFVFDDAVTALTETADGVDVTFARSAPRTFDMVIGADGLHSPVRGLVFGEESDVLHDLGVVISTFTVPDRWGLDRTQRTFVEPGRVATVSDTRVAGEARAILMFPAHGRAYDYRDVESQYALLSEVYEGAAWDVPFLLEQARRAPDFYLDACAQVRLDRWSAGRVALVGDAACAGSPLSGQGTSVALVGAYVLAGELAAADGDHRVAFSRYEERLREFARLNNKFALGMAKRVAPATPWQTRLHLWQIRMIPYTPGKNLVFKLIGRQVKKAATAVAVPDYPVPEVSPR